ncbi:MAG: sigma-54 dependent transcriptional regulator [Steroidobacteraceae bacterium]|jgi:DNA-binding NtrC family response regulator|nr:sigma-54 dependent transcriptional regulator [Steroidobacteraceae bacterium]
MSLARILVVDDETDIRDTLREILGEEGYEVEVAANAAEARAACAKQDPDLVLLDIWMPDTDGITLLREWSDNRLLSFPVVMLSGHGTVETAVEATRLGAVDFVEKPLSLTKLLRTVEKALDAGRRRRQSQRSLIPPLVAPVGKSRLMLRLREQVAQVATHDAPVLLVGEMGTGREAFARYLHSLGPRASGPFVALNCAGVDEANAVARLRGSETGGVVQPGAYDEAQGGTLLLAGLEDLPPPAQRALHADLEAGGWTRDGGSDRIPLRMRVVATALPGIESPESEGVRRDLVAQVAVVTLRVPPLREYAEDVPDLLRHYVDRLVDEEHLGLRRFSVAAQNRLRNYPWPGNVRELRNLVQRLLIVGGPEEIGLEEIERELAVQQPGDEPLVKQDLLALPLREAREAFERAYLLQQLMLCNGRVGLLAKRVGMERTHLYRKLRSLGVDFRQISDE